MSIYLDNAATTAVCPEAAQAALDAMTVQYANPGSPHAMGRAAAALVERGRAQVAAALDCRPEELFFTSCGTEGDNWALRRGAEYNARHGKHILSSRVEHPAVLRTLEELEARQGFALTLLKPEKDGSVSPEAVLEALREDTCLVSLMCVNNETGAVTDIAAIARAVRARCPHALIHTDAVQAFLHVPLSARSLGADLITLSGHKVHAPKGIGALYIRKGLNLPALLTGGGQEGGRRSGTPAVELIAAFGAAAEAGARSFAEDSTRMAALRAHMAGRLEAENPGLLLLGGGAPQLLSLSLPGWRSEVLMNFLEARDICVARSSACKRGGRSQVLSAMGLPGEVIDGVLRVSLSRYTTREEADAFCDAIREARGRIRASLSVQNRK
ncbi:MAG: cysteine desulfurase [Oscillospiraceae bacterium]|nr:cysteine desulfurase [Oscillospiraceae bacterium]